ncbi:MAG: LysR family transcriptional regulator [Clostridiales bacterium]|nr:LysR family transcriptional regulator [Clostridiales bacterium]
MNTLLLKYAVEIERAGSITQAADNLYMGQPNLSKAIKELEDTLGISIFKRTSKGMVTTQKGEIFLKYAKNVLSQIEAMEQLNYDNPGKQLFNISITRASYIAKAVTNFVKSLDMNKEIEINVEETNSMRVVHNVAEGQFNLGIIRYQSNYESYFLDFLANKEFLHTTIWEFECLVIMSKNHPLANCNELKCEDLQQYTEIIYGDTCIPYINIEGAQNTEKSVSSQKVIYVYERCNQLDLLSNVPNTFLWGAPIPEDLAVKYDLVQRRCKATNRLHKDVLIYPIGYMFSDLDKKFMDKLYESKNEVSLKNYI